MKRYVVGTLLFSIVMFVQLFGDIPVFADTFVPTSSYDFTGLADLGYALVGGAEFDFDGSPYVIDNYNSLTAEQKEIEKSLAARQFLIDYMESRDIAFEENGELQKGSAYYTIAFGLAGQEFFEAFQRADVEDQENLTYNMPISPSRFADWAQYNKFWFNKYRTSFEDSDQLVPNPDVNYLTYIDAINGSGFIFADWPQFNYNNPNSSSTYGYYPLTNVSWFSNNDLTNNRCQNICVNTITDVHIYSVGENLYDVNILLSDIPLMFPSYGVRYRWGDRNNNSNIFSAHTSNQATTFTYSDHDTLQNVFNRLSIHVKNVNIYVDNELWALAYDPAPANPVVPTFPDILNQTGRYDDLAYDIPLPNTDTYSGTFDLTSLFDAVREGIAGASDNDLTTGTTIGVGDVTRSYEGEGIDINERVVDLTSSRVFDGTLTDDTTGRLPKPPVNPGAVSAGLGGVTVLAKYVDATQCILPEDLMTAFWGCVWILIILGLIKNLHR